MYRQEREKAESLSKRFHEVMDENAVLRQDVNDYKRVKEVMGQEEVEKIVKKAKISEEERRGRNRKNAKYKLENRKDILF